MRVIAESAAARTANWAIRRPRLSTFAPSRIAFHERREGRDDTIRAARGVLEPPVNGRRMSTDSEHLASDPQRALRWAFFLGTVGIMLYLCGAILRPFLNVIAWSSVISIAFYPVYQRILMRTQRPSLSALVCSVAVVVTILIPLVIVAVIAVNQLLALKDYVERTFQGGVDLRAFESLRQAWEWLIRRVGLDPGQIADTLSRQVSEIGRIAAGHSLGFLTNVTGAIVSFVFTIFAMFFLLRDGSRMVGRIPDFLPFERARSETVLVRIRQVIYASIYGVLVIAAIQGILIGLSFAILGIPSAALWGVVTGLTSVIPMLGAGAVWVPGSLYLLVTGHWVKALLLVAWGGGVISSVDNFLRPRLVAGRVGLSELIMFFAVLGGLRVFGLLGIIMGPIVFAVAASLLELLRDETSMPAPAEPARPGGQAP
jgi:predicted PurR-regulated permease PerM